jgi:hypothetical protein
MISWFTLCGLILEIIGVGILLRDELTPLAARIKQTDAKAEGGILCKTAFWLANIFGSKDPLDQQSYVEESLCLRLCGFLLLLLGFIAQAVGIVINLLSTL